MRATTVRFSEDLWRLIEAEAERQGVSAAQYIRDAAVMRTKLAAERRQDAGTESALAGLTGPRGRRPTADPLAAVSSPARLEALHATGVLDQIPGAAFDRLTALAARVLHAPVATVTLVDADRQVWKSQYGLGEPWAGRGETPLSHSFCQHVVANRVPLVVSDAREHPVLRDNRAVDELGATSYLGAPLMTGDGHVLGSLCVIDDQPRHWTSDQVEVLEDLAAAVMTVIERWSGTATVSEVKGDRV